MLAACASASSTTACSRYTVGGAERWYRNLAERLAADGHEVTYLTLRQWERGEHAQIDARVRVVTVGPRMALYTVGGRRRILPPLVFGLGVLAHLLRHGRRYDVVHTCSFPYFSLLAAATRAAAGWIRARGRLVRGLEPLLLARLPRRPGGHRRRARTAPLRARAPARVLLLRAARRAAARGGAARRGDGAARAVRRQHGACRTRRAADPARAVRRAPDPREAGDARRSPRSHSPPIGSRGCAESFSATAPSARRSSEAIAAHGLQRDRRARRGFAETETVDTEMRRALCMLLPSRREGYGLVVVEAAAQRHAERRRRRRGQRRHRADRGGRQRLHRTERRARGRSPTAIVRVHEAGIALRESTARWFAENAERLSLEHSLRTVLESYAGGGAPS